MPCDHKLKSEGLRYCGPNPNHWKIDWICVYCGATGKYYYLEEDHYLEQDPCKNKENGRKK